MEDCAVEGGGAKGHDEELAPPELEEIDGQGEGVERSLCNGEVALKMSDRDEAEEVAKEKKEGEGGKKDRLKESAEGERAMISTHQNDLLWHTSGV